MESKETATRNMFGFTRGDSNADLPALSEEAHLHMTAVIGLLDEVHARYLNDADARQFSSTFGRAREVYERLRTMLPAGDLRLNLLDTTIDAYQQAGTLLLAREMGQRYDKPDPLVAVGGIRKEFLKQLHEGRLDASGQEFLNFMLGR